jgi:hypothetical protein
MARNSAQGEPTDAAWKGWSEGHADLLRNAHAPQRVLLEAAVRFMATIAGHPIMTRMAAFFLLHARMGLTTAQVGAAVGRTDRAMRFVQALSAQELVESIWRELGRHRTPKLSPEHAGPIAKYLVEHPDSTVEDILAFVRSALGISVDRQTLRRFSKTYHFEVLRGRADESEGEDERPFFSAARALEVPSSCSPSRSG